MELEATIQFGKANQQAGFMLGKSADDSEQTRIYCDYQPQRLEVDRRHLSTVPTRRTTSSRSRRRWRPAILPRWYIFTDGSVVEVFINDELAFDTRMYPNGRASNGLDAFGMGTVATLTAAWGWQLEILPTPAAVPVAPMQGASCCARQLASAILRLPKASQLGWPFFLLLLPYAPPAVYPAFRPRP